jgi:hypothetical protein
VFNSSRPIRSINSDSIEFGIYRDTLLVSHKLKVLHDTLALRKFVVSSQWEEDTKYKILLKPGTVYDIYGRTNDSAEISFSTRPMDYYGRILMTFSSFIYPMVIQVKDEKGTVVRTAIAEKPGVITFDFLTPGRYSFKAFYDENKNGHWDTGSYFERKQAEKTYISGKPQQLRSNWDWETSWSINENSGE